MLRITNLQKRYGKKQVFEGVTHCFPVGLTLLVGPSGAGKSTLLRVLATAEQPSAGTIEWDGRSLRDGKKAMRGVLGYAPQAVELPEDLTAQEFALYMAALKGLDLGNASKQFLAIAATLGLHQDVANKIATFSGGMRRRLIFAQALLGAPRLLLLDEPTAELDKEASQRVSAIVLEMAQTAIVVMITHLADDLAPNATAVLTVQGGTVQGL